MTGIPVRLGFVGLRMIKAIYQSAEEGATVTL